MVEDNVYRVDYILWNANFTESFVNISTVYQDFGKKAPYAVDLDCVTNLHDQFLEVYLPYNLQTARQSLQGLDAPAMLHNPSIHLILCILWHKIVSLLLYFRCFYFIQHAPYEIF